MHHTLNRKASSTSNCEVCLIECRAFDVFCKNHALDISLLTQQSSSEVGDGFGLRWQAERDAALEIRVGSFRALKSAVAAALCQHSPNSLSFQNWQFLMLGVEAVCKDGLSCRISVNHLTRPTVYFMLSPSWSCY